MTFCYNGQKLVGKPDAHCYRSSTNAWFVSGDCSEEVAAKPDGTVRVTAKGK